MKIVHLALHYSLSIHKMVLIRCVTLNSASGKSRGKSQTMCMHSYTPIYSYKVICTNHDVYMYSCCTMLSYSGYAVPRARHQLMYTVKAALVWTPANAWMWHDLVFESTVTRISGIGIMIHFPVLYINFVCFCYVMKGNSQVSVDSWLRIYEA